MEANHLIGGAVGIGLITAFWNKIKFIGSRLFSLLVVRVHVESHVAKALSLYCWTKMRRSPFGERRYNSETEFVRTLRRYQKIAFEEIGKDPIIFWNGWKPLLIGQTASEGKEVSSNSYAKEKVKVTMTFLRFMFDPDKLLTDAIDLLNERHEKGVQKNRYAVYRIIGMNNGEDSFWNKETKSESGSGAESRFALGDKRVLKWHMDNLGPFNEDTNALNCLALPPKAEEMVKEARFWKDSEHWYRSHQIPWRRGWLLHGPPGTGKTSLVRAIGQELDLPVFVFDLATLTNRSLQSEWRNMLNWVPCVALFEDIDSVFEGRKNVVRTDVLGGVTFDCLLNCLDGIETANGIFVAMTTNDISKVDPALGGAVEGDGFPPRPGRIDRVLELGPLDEPARFKVAKRILDECPDQIARIVAAGKGDTGAIFEERCARVARAYYWGEEEPQGQIEERPRLMRIEEAPDNKAEESSVVESCEGETAKVFNDKGPGKVVKIERVN